MTTEEAIVFFDPDKKRVRVLADKLGITVQSVYEWGEVPPRGRQFEIQALSGGALLASTCPPGKAA